MHADAIANAPAAVAAAPGLMCVDMSGCVHTPQQYREKKTKRDKEEDTQVQQ